MRLLTRPRPDVSLLERVRVDYSEKSFLGIFKWFVRVSSVGVGMEIHITTDQPIDTIVFNGERIDLPTNHDI